MPVIWSVHGKEGFGTEIQMWLVLWRSILRSSSEFYQLPARASCRRSLALITRGYLPRVAVLHEQ